MESSSTQSGSVSEDQFIVFHPSVPDPVSFISVLCPSFLSHPGSLVFQGLENQLNPKPSSHPGAETEAVPPTPDVDLLLECTFSYMHNTEEDERPEQPSTQGPEDEFLSPLIKAEAEEEEEEEVG